MREAGADIVAEHLLALHADPVRHRWRLTHGREPFPGALEAFRFAQGRFPKGLVKQSSTAELARLREAAEFFIRQVCLWEDASHYQVLGVSPESPPVAVKANYQALMALLHPDRQGAGSGHWPASAAQRVNQAYAVLSNDALRREYEAGTGKATHTARDFTPFEAPPAGAAPAARVRNRAKGAASARAKLFKSFLVGTAAVAGLFVLNVWWVSDLPDEYATLQSATPLENSWRWMRDTLSADARPRFFGSSPAAATPSPVADEPPIAIARRPEPALVPITLAMADVIPQARTDALPEARLEPTRSLASQPSKPVEVTPVPKAERRSPVTVAQAPAKVDPPSPQASGAIGELESLVTQLVSHYEAGDLDRLLGLFDTESVGVLDAMNMRRDFDGFFRSTGSRQLRLRSITWESASFPARAQGDADLSAAWTDRPGRIERTVKLDIGIAWRNGRPRIARLSLFPHE